MKNKFIEVAGPAYRGAPHPKFSELSINESKFEDGLRFKEYDAKIEDGSGYVEWLSQVDEYPTSLWENEVIRAFKANGLDAGAVIHVKFGSRDTGYIKEYDLAV